MMQANPFLVISFSIWIGVIIASVHASVRDVSESPMSASSNKLLTSPVNSSGPHPNHVTYPLSARKAKLDDGGGGVEDMTPGSDMNNLSNDSKNMIPIAKAATDTSSASNSSTKSRCDRPRRPHSGLIIKPFQKVYSFGQTIVYQCHNGVSNPATCQEDGQWSRAAPYCPPTNQSCPLHIIANGNVTYSPFPNGQRPLRSRANFKCNSGFELVGAPMVVCEKEFEWSYKTPACLPIRPEKSQSSGSLLTAVLLSIGALFSLVVVISGSWYYRWWRRKMQRKRWQRYFGNYTYRQSKHKINHPNPAHQEMKQFKATAAVIPSTEL